VSGKKKLSIKEQIALFNSLNPALCECACDMPEDKAG
jgi:hypothetical protein